MLKNQPIVNRVLLPICLLSIIALQNTLFAENPDSLWFSQHYSKLEYRIPMRDGKKLFTAVYVPKDTTVKHPIRMTRTPYSCAPYGNSRFIQLNELNMHYAKKQYILIWQDVRGRFMSEGDFTDMTPYIEKKERSQDVDESTDAFDTIEWLIKNLPGNNGNVGIWGSSYPGFYALMASINAHPNLKAVIIQAPIADWFAGDDMHHNGAFTVQMAFNFFSGFGVIRDTLTTEWPKPLAFDSPDAYSFFLKLGPLSNINSRFFKHTIPIWENILTHGTYDDFWKRRCTLPHIKGIKPAVLLVGGWYDAEDFYGTMQTYRTIKNNSSQTPLSLIIGPWAHSTWNVVSGESFGDFTFPSATAQFYRDSIDHPFFHYYLNNEPAPRIPKTLLFNTGTYKWEQNLDLAKDAEYTTFFLDASGKLALTANQISDSVSYISDPQKPVPYTAFQIDARKFYNHPYMSEDQRFAAQRPDVLVFESQPVKEDITIAGSIISELYVSTTGTDADWIVKVIDVFPDSAITPENHNPQIEYGGYQKLLRGEIMRGKFRNSLSEPEAFIPGKPELVRLTVQDVFHTIKKGHKLMVQVQSSWFPLFDRNPQTFCNIYHCTAADFARQTHTVYTGIKYPSLIKLPIIHP